MFSRQKIKVFDLWQKNVTKKKNDQTSGFSLRLGWLQKKVPKLERENMSFGVTRFDMALAYKSKGQSG